MTCAHTETYTYPIHTQVADDFSAAASRLRLSHASSFDALVSATLPEALLALLHDAEGARSLGDAARADFLRALEGLCANPVTVCCCLLLPQGAGWPVR